MHVRVVAAIGVVSVLAGTVFVGAYMRGTARAAASPVEATVDVRATRQVIQGFGSSERVWADPHLADDPRVAVPADAQAKILTTLYRTIGLTRVRNVLDQGVQTQRGGPYEFGGKLADAHIAYVKQARRYGLRLFFPGPVYLEPWMTENDPEATVEWALAMLRRWRAQGLAPMLYAPLNEPFIAGNYKPDWMRRVVILLGRRLRAEGFATKLVVPDDENPADALRRAEAVLSDPDARRYVAALAYHVYRWGRWDLEDLARLRQLATRYSLPLWMTEYSTPEYAGWDASLDWAEKMHVLLTTGGVNAIDYLWGFFGEKYGTDALVSIDFDGGAYRGHSVTPVGWITAQYAHFVRPGFVRVASTASQSSVLVSAYRGPRRVVVVATNAGGSPSGVRVRVTGAKLMGKVGIVRSSKTEGLRSLEPVRQKDGVFSVTLAPQSVTTFVAKR